MAQVLAAGRSRFGALNGVIHAAGRRDETSFAHKTYEDFMSTLAPKIRGTEILDRLTAEDDLELFVIFSSAAAVLGDYGECDYALANRWADGLAVLREGERVAGRRRGCTVAVNWPLWRAGGMR